MRFQPLSSASSASVLWPAVQRHLSMPFTFTDALFHGLGSESNGMRDCVTPYTLLIKLLWCGRGEPYIAQQAEQP